MGILVVVALRFKMNAHSGVTGSRNSPAIIIPSGGLLRSFKYKNLVNRTTCFVRREYRREFINVIGADPEKFDFSKSYILVIGANTAIGNALIDKLRGIGKSVIAIGDITNLDLRSHLLDKLFEGIKVEFAFFSVSPGVNRHAISSSKDLNIDMYGEYVRGCARFISTFKCKFIWASTPPHMLLQAERLSWFGSAAYMFPYIVDLQAVNDLENPLARLVQECKMYGRATAVLNTKHHVHSITAHEAASFLVDKMLNFKREVVVLHGSSEMTLADAADVVQEYMRRCSIERKSVRKSLDELYNFADHQLIGAKRGNVDSMLRSALKNVASRDRKDPYLSIVIVGRNDNFGGSYVAALQDYLLAVSVGLKSVPLADIEVIIVDGTDGTVQALSQTLSIPDVLQGRIRFVESRNSLPDYGNNIFPQYAAKNLGIASSLGSFVLVTSPYVILPRRFFEWIAEKQLNSAILYRSLVLEERNDARHSITEIMDNIDKVADLPSFLQLGNITLERGKYCIIDDLLQMKICGKPEGINDFLLVSRDVMWSLGAMNEYPANRGIDRLIVAKFMRIVPGIIEGFIEPIAIKRWHQPGVSIILPENETEQIIKEYFCLGRSETANTYSKWDEMLDFGEQD